jgi:hypothetical protein
MIMAGYFDQSMSNNAMDAYSNGEKPKSKWTKKTILAEIQRKMKCVELELVCSFDKLKKLPLPVLQENFLEYSSWHHTSMYYNRTDFFRLDLIELKYTDDEELDEMFATYRDTVEKKKKEAKRRTLGM